MTVFNTLNRIMQNAGLRKPYNTRHNIFLEDQITVKDPLDLFTKWFKEASGDPSIIEPHVMCLSTATRDGMPAGRLVLCKGFGKEGFQFYTHYTSRKGKELEENPNAALTFFWAPLSKSVRIEGSVEKLPISCAEEYFKNRPYQSQLGALCSEQSEVIDSRTSLTKKSLELQNKYKEGDVPRPESWGGYTVVPRSMEFWQGQTDRIHDRIKFRRAKDGETPDNVFLHAGEDNWVYERLQP